MMQSSLLCTSCPNSKCMVKYCSPEWQEIISQKKSIPSYPGGQYVFQEGSLVLGAYFIYKGKVKVVSANSVGKEQTVRLAADGHMLGHMGLGQELYPVGAKTMDNSKICFVDNETLYEAFMANPKFTFQIMMFYSRELRKSELRTKCFAQMNLEEKIIYALTYMADSFGISETDHSINVPLSRQDIADIIGTNSDQVSRIITLLKDKGLIDTKNKKIQLLNIKKLKDSLSGFAIPQVSKE